MSEINIVMACFNNCEQTDRTIKSILKNTISDFTFIIVNNGSTDNTHNMIQEKYISDERIDYLQAEENGGCGIGRNIGLRNLEEDCKYVILIDNDIYAPEEWDRGLIRFMNNHPEVGIGGAASNFAGTPQQIENFPNLETEDQIESYAKTYRPEVKYTIVPQRWPVIGFCQIVRREIYSQIGLFDEGFRLYGCEDNDFCYRAEKAGWKLAYIHSSFVYHYGHGGLSMLGGEGIEQWGKNREYFKQKHGFI